ncbi:unnamed protein product [Darwinula stevensoni]|uniref:WH1 domain-containing protein n=1 Tax=Darwinula stevensoni TaxID=69355 RepID=A0A7R8ZY24_9CRUS|nr:unnamed protein product [Darwinula stevensoni]CAG0880643.1 unnamed protein product [Darwinula stevensoni]
MSILSSPIPYNNIAMSEEETASRSAEALPEQSIASARASVMVYDDVLKKWIHSGSSTGLSKVHIYQHVVNSAFRVVGRKLQDHEVVINCAILKGLKYNQATPTFHQWRDNKQVYGLNFSSKDDADNFATAMMRALDILNGIAPPRPLAPLPTAPTTNQPQIPIPAMNQPIYQSIPSGVGPGGDWDDGYRSLTREEAIYYPDRRGSAQQPGVMMNHSNSSSNMMVTSNGPSVGTLPPGAGSGIPPAPPPPNPPSSATLPPGHHRTSSAPPAPHPPQPPPFSNMGNGSDIVGPPAPPLPPVMGGCPPPPPPPPPGDGIVGGSNGTQETSSLAAALQNAKLKKRQPTAESSLSLNSSNSSGSGGGTYGTLGRVAGGGMAEMMDEMAKTLARRRAAAENKDPSQEYGEGLPKAKSDKLPPPTNGRESPKTSRRRLSSSEDNMSPRVNGVATSDDSHFDLEGLKQEILKEMKKEMNKVKLEIIEDYQACVYVLQSGICTAKLNVAAAETSVSPFPETKRD